MALSWFGWLRRRWFGKYRIDDPRPNAANAPYTFYLPSENELLAIVPGDVVQVIIRSIPQSHEWHAERMWVGVTMAGERMSGTLANVPLDMPQLRYASRIDFRRGDIIDIQWSSDRMVPPPPSPARRWYWERCMVDDCVLRGTSPVDYLYREDPDLTQDGDRFPDSGWRIRGTDEAIALDVANGCRPEYVAIGAVLNHDDRWLSLIDAPTGSAFIREADTGQFTACRSA